jgi:hypothetical protein
MTSSTSRSLVTLWPRARRDGDAGVVGEIAALEQRQAQTLQQIDEHDGAVFELLADDALGRQAKTLAVEAQRRFEVVHAKRDQSDAGFHGFAPASAAGRGVQRMTLPK